MLMAGSPRLALTPGRETRGQVEVWARILSSGLGVCGTRDPGHLHGGMLGWRFHKQVRNPEEGISGDPCAQMTEGMRVRNPLLI